MSFCTKRQFCSTNIANNCIIPDLSSYLPPFEYRHPSEMKIGVGLSGGIDSSAVAYIVKKCHGFGEVIAIWMSNWREENHMSNYSCSQERELNDIRQFCQYLEIPLKIIDFSDEYYRNIFAPYIELLSDGYFTPNPDTICARMLTFDALHNYARNELNLDYICTGHYAQIEWRIKKQSMSYFEYQPFLHQSNAQLNNQTYFLSRIDSQSLYYHLFPIGSFFNKNEQTRKLMTKMNDSKKSNELLNKLSQKPSSDGLCYANYSNIESKNNRKLQFKSFLSQFVDKVSMDDITFSNHKILDIYGRKIGLHFGLAFYTIGEKLSVDKIACFMDCKKGKNQRRNKNVFGMHLQLYVIAKRVKYNELIVVVNDANHCSLNRNRNIIVFEWHWISKYNENNEKFIFVEGKFCCRYLDKLFDGCACINNDTGFANINLTQGSVRAVTPGQVIAFYVGKCCVASAIILQ